MSIAVYKQKRNFSKTPEPGPGKGKKGKSLTFVVQRHHASHLHYDFRLEMEGVLKSWAVPKGPSMKAGEKRLAMMVEDHPLPYGKFFGTIPKGNYGAGTVDIWDNGTYEPMEKQTGKDAQKQLLSQLHKGDIKFVLHGKHLNGAFALVQMKGAEQGNSWLLIKKKDAHAKNAYAIDKIAPVKTHKATKDTWVSDKEAKTSKATPKTPAKKAVSNHKKENSLVKEKISEAWKELQTPMLAKLSTSLKNNEEWIYETKYDGYRAITKMTKGKVEMVSRRGNSFNRQYQSLIEELEKIEDEAIIDGEVVIEDKRGVSNFQLLQNYGTTGEGVLKYYVFDILFLNGYRLIDLPLLQRKELLRSFFDQYKFKNILFAEVTEGKGEQLFKKLTAKGYEGIIAKDSHSLYRPDKRSDSWLKIKSTMMQEAIICGYTLPQKSRKYFGSLVLGLYEGKKLKYIGNCGTGFTEASLEELHKQFSKMETKTCPFPGNPTLNGTKGKPVWLKPQLVCNVKFAEWTKDGMMRVPVFMGLRKDKEAKQVLNETKVAVEDNPMENEEETADNSIMAEGKKVSVTNLAKVYWPEEGITKGDLIQYYERISKYILPYLKNRPESLNRFPNGIKGQSFYQKDMDLNQLPGWTKTARIYSKSNKEYIDYLICNDTATLLYMANLGCIEINPWHSTYDKPDHPDYMMLDLDPGKIDFKEVVKTALVIKDICDELSIDCFCKTSGATGLHIYIPLGAKYTYDEVKTFAELIATLAHHRLPKTTSIERLVAKRTNKVYIDFLQNRKGQTIAAPYSVRPRPYATVSTPLLWKEVNEKLTPQQFTIHNIEKRLTKTGDLWKGVLGKGILLDKALKKMEKLL
jgi:bifunctional non-homologous end joining protein LigD